MAILDLTNLKWTLVGWRPYTWKLNRSMPLDLGPFPTRVPGTVQRALLDAGIIEDWNMGLNSRACEWIEHRHWEFITEIGADAIPRNERAVLDAEGLDYVGWILVDDREIARFEGALSPHRFDLSEILSDGRPHRLAIVFEEPPPEQGQIGFTSLSRFFKPRYNYSWDWCPRIVPIGVHGALSVKTGTDAGIDLVRIRTALAEDNQTGTIEVTVAAARDVRLAILTVTVLDQGREIGRSFADWNRAGSFTLSQLAVQPWWPNGAGAQKLYDVIVEAIDAGGQTIWSKQTAVGFRRIDWLPCEGASADAEPWICAVNGKPIFLQGANWVPPRAMYPDATDDDYRVLIAMYREMGCNVLRVWGGAILETERFYSLCDEAGILVWQEFPLSSSGVENYPPDAPEAIARLRDIAKSYIRRRSHHVSLLLWCGGNELTRGEGGAKQGVVPIDYTHPCIAMLRDLVQAEDPGRRFIPTSPSGPRFSADAKEYGQGLHHDIHGPWGMGGFADLEAWRQYWAGDDSLFRSEVGMPGAADAGHILRYVGERSAWPPTSEYWLHTAAWWIEWNRHEKALAGLDDGHALAEYVRRTQQQQAEAYAIAAKACKNRFPRCGGFILWMGHDLYPCPINNSVIDFDRTPKPAYRTLQRVFLS